MFWGTNQVFVVTTDELNKRVRDLREEITKLPEKPGTDSRFARGGNCKSYLALQMGKKKVLVKINPDGKFIVDITNGD